MVNVLSGDMFKKTYGAYVNPVNTVGVMGAGLAKVFRNLYGNAYYDHYRMACVNGDLMIGCVLWYLYSGTWIVNFPTKKHWRDKSQMGWIESGLKSLRRTSDIAGVSSMAIPALGCGLGGLNFDDVLAVIEYHMKGSSMLIDVYRPGAV